MYILSESETKQTLTNTGEGLQILDYKYIL